VVVSFSLAKPWVVVGLFLFLPWMLNQLLSFTTRVLGSAGR
jgi:flagellar biosynthesis protein FliQ